MQIESIKVSDIAPNPRQPRNVTEPVGEMETVGQIHPIMVMPMSRVPKAESSSQAYMVIDGHRRLAAAKAAGMESVKAYVEDIDFEEAMLRALIANKEQQTYGPVEEARAILDSLANRFGDELMAAYNKEDNEWSREWGRRLVVRAAQDINHHESHGWNSKLCDDVVAVFTQWCGRAGYTVGAIQAHIAKHADIPPDLEEQIAKKPGEPGKLSISHAEELAKIEDEGLRRQTMETVKREGKTVHETRALQKAIRSDVVTSEEKKKLARGDMKPQEIKNPSPPKMFDEVSGHWEKCADEADGLIGRLTRDDYPEVAPITEARMRSVFRSLHKRLGEILGDIDEDVIDAEVIE